MKDTQQGESIRIENIIEVTTEAIVCAVEALGDEQVALLRAEMERVGTPAEQQASEIVRFYQACLMAHGLQFAEEGLAQMRYDRELRTWTFILNGRGAHDSRA